MLERILVLALIALFFNLELDAQEINSEKAIELYSNQETFKGLEVYVWQSQDNQGLYFGVLKGTNHVKNEDDFQLLYDNPIDLETIKEIFNSYPEDTFISLGGIEQALSEEVLNLLKEEFKELKQKDVYF